MKPLLRFHKSVGLLLLLNLLLKPLWVFVVDRNIQLHFGNETYGQYYSLVNLSLIFTVWIDFGLTNYFIANNAHHGTQLKSIQLNTILIAKLLGTVFYFTVTVFSFFVLSDTQFILLVILCFIQIVNSYFISLRAALQSKQDFKVDTFFSLFDKSLAFIIMLIVLFTPFLITRLDIFHYASIQLLCLLASCILLYFYIEFKNKNIIKIGLSLKSVFSVIHKASSYALVIICMSVLLRSDVFLLKFLKGNIANGEYAYGLRFFDTLNNFGYLIISYLFPFLCFHFSNKPLIQKTVTQYGNYGSITISVGILFFFFLRHPICEILYKQHNDTVITIVLFCCIAFLGTWWVHVYGTLLTAGKYLRSLILVTISAIIVSVTLNLTFIPLYGALAAATILAVIQLAYGFSLYLLCLHKKLI
jgi:O-antigen/teichoic acid export membrane protein